ncbi:Crp/Fnr family transcriptional regulator [Bradyrhizobium sp. OAE829]|uniref:Crp/Fnr family transcriptional regulator n=1 Tax=Bradyrhizobium sp. OAE829 TaxID=2663807 RepID=UPI001789E35C
MPSNEIKNLLLAALPRNAFEALRPDLVHVELESRTPIYLPDDEVEWVYFPSTGMISILQSTADSRGIELATVGKEGALGAIAGFGLNRALTAAVVQMPLTALKISAVRFRKHLTQFASLQEMALKSNEVILAQTQVTAACNALHNVKQRFCRWLLQSWDRSEGDTIPLTQEFLGEMLGVRRTSVTEIASQLQAEGIIRYRRGNIEVVKRRELEKRSCECFHAVRRVEKAIMGIELKP